MRHWWSWIIYNCDLRGTYAFQPVVCHINELFYIMKHWYECKFSYISFEYNNKFSLVFISLSLLFKCEQCTCWIALRIILEKRQNTTFLHEHIYFQLGVFSTFNAVLASMLHSHAEIFKILFCAIWVNSCNTERDKRHHNKTHKHLYVVKHRKWELIVHSDWIVLLQFYKIQLTMTRDSTFCLKYEFSKV